MINKHKLFTKMLTAMLCVTSVSMAASAEREIPELEVQLLTDKENYSGDEEIAEIIQLYNPSSVSIEDIKIQTSVPEGYQIKNDWISSVAKMEAEETLQINVQFEPSLPDDSKSTEDTGDDKSTENTGDDKNTEDTGDDKNTENTGDDKNTENTGDDKNTEDTGDDKNTEDTGDDKNTEDTGDDKNTEDTSDTKNTEDTSGIINTEESQGNHKNDANGSAHTGDINYTAMWLLLVLASLGFLVLFVRTKKLGKLFALVLTLGITGTVIQNQDICVKAQESVRVMEKMTSKTITVDNEEVTLSVKVTYTVKDETTDTDLSYEGYSLKWQDEFDGTTLNREDWNVELHDPGWVNEEWQSYVDSEENIYLKDGKLVLKPIKTVNEDGTVSYTSGRVNTQNKHDFKYGIFEARVKVPEGKGYLPAFWLMATNENQYGQWPRCGEIDIMEVHGSDTVKSYGTIHYGNPHKESQGNYILSEGSFSEEYHTFAVEWLPGRINWYVDGILFHTENDWYSSTEGQGEITYPAPFDQNFYIILNLAVGGSWIGYPDETTDFEQAAYEIDYVRVYQKDSYDENVTKPEKQVTLREPDETGNYIVNGDFAVAEDLTDDKDWIFLTALGGEATAEIKDNEISIQTEKEGTVDYSVQLVQPNLPMQKGGNYEICFDAYADSDRTMKVDVSAPDNGYVRYFNDTVVSLTTEKQTFTYQFTMTQNDDANGRIEFNMGNTGSAAGIKISNVTLKKIFQTDMTEEAKTILADGNYVYNGNFQEGSNRMAYWDVTASHANVSVTSLEDGRKLKVEALEGTSTENPVVISQNDLALSSGANYALSLKAEGEAAKEIQVMAAGSQFSAVMTGSYASYNYSFVTPDELTDRNVTFTITQPGIYYLDEVRIVEDTLIKNGSFNAGLAGYEAYIDSSANASCVVDSLTEDNAVDFTINDTGDQAWKIQLKQNNIELEEGQWYRLTLKAKSSMNRKLMFAIQRDGSSDNDWTPYSGEKIVDLTSDYQTFEIVFQMTHQTDLKSVLSISIGAVSGISIQEPHRICIDDINLEKIDAPTLTQAETFTQTDTEAGKESLEETAEASNTDIIPKTDSDAPAN